ncbi:hypothetical protein [Halorussus salinisoli]|nr:hypothetical protein [Halorussus salinisoli]
MAVPKGTFVELMARAERQESVAAEEIVETLDTDELPVEAETSWSVGEQ